MTYTIPRVMITLRKTPNGQTWKSSDEEGNFIVRRAISAHAVIELTKRALGVERISVDVYGSEEMPDATGSQTTRNADAYALACVKNSENR